MGKMALRPVTRRNFRQFEPEPKLYWKPDGKVSRPEKERRFVYMYVYALQWVPRYGTQWYKMAPPPGQSTTRAISGGFVPPTTLVGHRAGEDEEEGGGSMEPVDEGAPLRLPRACDACA
ncbi:hypothetical protein ALC57_16002 [Trachymyrmex cornetzi]|uniref:Uncharacterized protein n=1 Tax=Trachymyrmex cornetzi TaxID=471704 RepID=A0A195DG92_9HYME|nr:hypothetical protein ALC57_16002 [Trachymyrmex cornetzi]